MFHEAVLEECPVTTRPHAQPMLETLVVEERQSSVTSRTSAPSRQQTPGLWCIGSGVVESACKRVVGQRLKGGGMRWGEDGVDAVCHLRALFLSDEGKWKAFWNSN
jgi:hypothetical protein